MNTRTDEATNLDMCSRGVGQIDMLDTTCEMFQGRGYSGSYAQFMLLLLVMCAYLALVLQHDAKIIMFYASFLLANNKFCYCHPSDKSCCIAQI